MFDYNSSSGLGSLARAVANLAHIVDSSFCLTSLAR